MIVFKRKQKGETELNIPNWVAALVAVIVTLIFTVILTVRYYPAIKLWLK